MKKINKVGVIGAGTMGAGIAGQVANAGIEVWLLDLPSDNENVNSFSERGLERLKDPDMPGIMSCLLYTSPSPRDLSTSRMPSSA